MAIVASLCIGAYPVTLGQVIDILFHSAVPWIAHPDLDAKQVSVIAVIRPPRILLASFAGVGLGLSGAALQGMMRNPLVGPDLVGVSSGAAFGGVIGILFTLPSAAVVALAFLGGLVAMVCTFSLARLVRGRSEGIPLLLAGFFIGAFFLGAVGLIEYMARYSTLPLVVYWLLGSFRGADPEKVWTIAIPTIAGGAVLMGLRWRLNLLSLGDLDAASLGVNVKTLRWIIIAVVSLMVAAQVSVSGIVGWVGLIVPHCARMLVGPDHRRVLPASGLLGGLFLLGLDDLTRVLVHAEIPTGLLTAFFGTPIMAFLFWKTQTRAGPMSEAAVSFESLGFAYRPGVPIFRDYAASIRKGSAFAILGPNGRGKTTLLKLLLGVLKPTEGSISATDRIAFVPQLFHVSFDYTALDMVLMGRVRQIGMFSQPTAEDEAASLAALERFGLGHMARRPFHEMSGGQRQMVIFARALVAEADILILDEPTSALDLKNQALVLDWIRRLSREDGLTVIFTTHHPHHALSVADDALLMIGETDYATGPVREVLIEDNLQRLYGVPLKYVAFEYQGAGMETIAPVFFASGAVAEMP